MGLAGTWALVFGADHDLVKRSQGFFTSDVQQLDEVAMQEKDLPIDGEYTFIISTLHNIQAWILTLDSSNVNDMKTAGLRICRALRHLLAFSVKRMMDMQREADICSTNSDDLDPRSSNTKGPNDDDQNGTRVPEVNRENAEADLDRVRKALKAAKKPEDLDLEAVDGNYLYELVTMMQFIRLLPGFAQGAFNEQWNTVLKFFGVKPEVFRKAAERAEDTFEDCFSLEDGMFARIRSHLEKITELGPPAPAGPLV